MPCRTCLQYSSRLELILPGRNVVQDSWGGSGAVPDGPELPEEFEELLGSHVVAAMDGWLGCCANRERWVRSWKYLKFFTNRALYSQISHQVLGKATHKERQKDDAE